MLKKLVTVLLLGILLIFATMTTGLCESENLLTNGGFETINASGGPAQWYTTAYRTQEGFTRFEITDEKAHTGQYSAKITNANTNDARYVCEVKVKPSSMYRVSGYILVESMEDFGNGANFAVEDVYAFSDGVYDTQSKWQYVEWYGETDENQTTVLLDVRVGGYGAESQGIAYFDDLSVTEVDTLPEDISASLWFTVDSGSAAVAEDATDTSTDTTQKNTALFVLLGLVFLLLTALAVRTLLHEENHTLDKPKTATTTVFFWLLMGLALVLRLVLGGLVAGYQVDMNCFAAWGIRMAVKGPVGFYSPVYFCDYPPGYMLLLWPVGLLINAVGYADSPTIRLLVKAIPILTDMAAAILLFAYAKKRLPLKVAVLVGLFFAFNPAAIVNGSSWGQVDSVLALLMLLTAISAMDLCWRSALPLFIVAVLMKPQALLFAPIGGIWLLFSLFRVKGKARKAQWTHIWQGLLIALGCAAAIIVPFSIGQEDPLWLWKLYAQTLSSYPYATLNTANLMYLLGGNWSHLTAEDGAYVASLSAMIPAFTGGLLLAFGTLGAALYRGANDLRGRLQTAVSDVRGGKGFGDNGRKLVLSLLCLLFGLAFIASSFWPVTYLRYGTMWMVFVYLFALLALIADGRAEILPFVMALMLTGVYVLGVKIHERYLFAALLLLPLAYIRIRDRRLLWLCAGLSVTTFLNTAIVLDNSILLGSSMGHLNQDTLALNDIICMVNLLLCGWGGWIAYSGLAPSPALQRKPLHERRTNDCYRNPLLKPADARLHLTGRDWLIMGVTVVVYSALAFTNLGSTKAPQTAWVATSADEQVVFELEQEQTFKMLYYAGVSYNNFSVSVSNDGETWSDAYPMQMREGLCYRWLYAVTSKDSGTGTVTFEDSSPENVLWLTGKYLRVNAESAGLNLWEILLRDKDGNRIPVTLISHNGARDVLETAKPPENLIDEQTTLEGEPSWFNGTYFDEIYHARTAYEHLHGISPYETTHPPLGKLIMSVGIAIFGMTPFGWRFMGTLTGVLMLPALYLLAKQLTRRRDLATFAMVVFSLDLMHFTQTRIATIDSFPVLFIILSMLCMLRYLKTDVYAVPAGLAADVKPRVLTGAYLRTLIPLGLSGLFMGLSIASKWIGLNSAVGLAILFGMAAYRQFRTGLVAYDIDLDSSVPEEQRTRVLWARQLTLRRILVTCLFCVLFFIAVPALIYYLSYIPYLSPSGPVTINRIVKAQIGMYDYHSTPGLGMDHPFYSPWWQWPLILKPMWFCRDAFEPEGWASTIMCMGNPWIFYIGAVSMLAILALFARKYLMLRGGLRLRQGNGDLTLPFMTVGFLAQYLPWVLVPRSMYIYHYFASVPFIIMATMLLIQYIPNVKMARRVMLAYCIAAAVFFLMFFPYASGLMTPTWYLDWLKWFPKLYY